VRPFPYAVTVRTRNRDPARPVSVLPSIALVPCTRHPPSVVDLVSGTGENSDVVAYDTALADRIRALLAGSPGLTEKKMFGGLAFLVRGNMAVAASGQGGLLVRVDPAHTEKLVNTTPARVMVMRGRSMPGWLRVSADDVGTKPALARWVELSSSYVGSLPAKKKA